MNRDTLWSRMKTAGITQSKRQDCPPDVDLKIVLQHAQVSAKGLIDFLCSLDSKPASSLARDEEKPIF